MPVEVVESWSAVEAYFFYQQQTNHKRMKDVVIPQNFGETPQEEIEVIEDVEDLVYNQIEFVEEMSDSDSDSDSDSSSDSDSESSSDSSSDSSSSEYGFSRHSRHKNKSQKKNKKKWQRKNRKDRRRKQWQSVAEIALEQLDYEPETVSKFDFFVLGDFSIKPERYLPDIEEDHPKLSQGKDGNKKGLSKHNGTHAKKETRKDLKKEGRHLKHGKNKNHHNKDK